MNTLQTMTEVTRPDPRLPRIGEMSPADGLFVESLMASIAQGTDEAKQRMREFLVGRAAKVGGPAGESGSPNEPA